jgi:hypothetical protein
MTESSTTKLNPPPPSTITSGRASKDNVECRDAVEARPGSSDVHQKDAPTLDDSSDVTRSDTIAEEKKADEATDNSASPNGESKKQTDPDLSPSAGIDYSNLEETPYEHNFQPGDHVIRWDMLPILWPIQIHGIVLEVSDDKTTVTICDFGITTGKNEDKDKKNVDKIAEDDAKFKKAMDLASELDVDAKKKKAESKRLNIIRLTKWSDLRKWTKVNYDGGLLTGGMGKSLKGLGEKTEKLWTSTKQIFAKRESAEVEDDFDSLEDVDSLDMMEVQNKIVQAVKRKDSKGSGVVVKHGGEPKAPTEDSPSAASAKEKILDDFLSGGSEHSGAESNAPSEEQETTVDNAKDSLDEPKSLAQMVADANEVERQSPRKTIVKSTPSSPAKKTTEEKQQSWRGSFMKSLSNIFPQNDEKKSLNLNLGDEKKSEKKDDTPNLPRSDPPKLVLARTRFLLAQGEDFLPPYHIVNSNSECIAVWCKTGRWSTLQASVFLHSTAIGNVKSTTVLSMTLAATQPWLLAAAIPAGMAAVGTPWLMLKVANDKWNDATMTLGEKFWMQAEPEVFVECIEKWGRLK